MVHKFTEEFELIQNDTLRELAVDAFCLYEDDDHLAQMLKKIIKYLIQFCEVIEADDNVRDVILVAGLLSGVGDSELDARIKMMDYMPKIGRDMYNNILYLIERKGGFKTPYPEYQPQIDSPIHSWLLPLAIQLATVE